MREEEERRAEKGNITHMLCICNDCMEALTPQLPVIAGKFQMARVSQRITIEHKFTLYRACLPFYKSNQKVYRKLVLSYTKLPVAA